MEQQWHGIPKPWHAYIGQTFGEYIVINYHNLPNGDTLNTPPFYRFMLSDKKHQIHYIDACNILQLEKSILLLS